VERPVTLPRLSTNISDGVLQQSRQVCHEDIGVSVASTNKMNACEHRDVIRSPVEQHKRVTYFPKKLGLHCSRVSVK
jgi:hypothetical protein